MTSHLCIHSVQPWDLHRACGHWPFSHYLSVFLLDFGAHCYVTCSVFPLFVLFAVFAFSFCGFCVKVRYRMAWMHPRLWEHSSWIHQIYCSYFPVWLGLTLGALWAERALRLKARAWLRTSENLVVLIQSSRSWGYQITSFSMRISTGFFFRICNMRGTMT